MEDANPTVHKRPRPEASGPAIAALGKGVAERMSQYAAPIIKGLKETLMKRALDRRLGMQKSKMAFDALDALRAKGKVANSLLFRPTELQKRLLAKAPEEQQGHLKLLEETLHLLALQERESELNSRREEFESILRGKVFTEEATKALTPDRFHEMHPGAPVALRDLIDAEQRDFHLVLAMKVMDLDDADAKKVAQAAALAEKREAARMEVEQQETSVTLKRFVEEEVKKAKPGLINDVKASLKVSSSPKRVHFKQGDGKRAGAGHSRGRSKTRSKSRPRSTDSRSGGRRGSSSRGRSATPGPRRAGKSSSRSKSRGGSKSSRNSSRSTSRGNGRGGRGNTSRGPPSGKQGGSGRVGGGGGSKTGSRR